MIIMDKSGLLLLSFLSGCFVSSRLVRMRGSYTEKYFRDRFLQDKWKEEDKEKEERRKFKQNYDELIGKIEN